MSKLFYTAKEFAAMQKRAEAAEAVVSGVKNHFGAAAEAEDFDVVSAVSTLGDPGDEQKDDNAEKVADLESKLNTANARIAELEKGAGAEATTTTASADGPGAAGVKTQESIIAGARELFNLVSN
jgi:hypothetical protein